MADTAWDYLILTASNERQADSYQGQVRVRQERGLLPQVREALVVPDFEGRRIGSGGATVEALGRVLERERRIRGGGSDERILRELRILIVHAGGDSRRLPAYGPCGKIFVPLPGGEAGPVPMTLFDRLAPEFLNLPEAAAGEGQVVVAAGDALALWDAAGVAFTHPGITALSCYTSPEEASRHGVYCIGDGGVITRYLQKPSLAEQAREGAIDASGKTALDIGVMSFDAATAARLVSIFGGARDRMARYGLDLYREICCALGTGATSEHYIRGARRSGSRWPEETLAEIYPALRDIPFHLEMLPRCRFLHFGSTKQLVESGQTLTEAPAGSTLVVNSEVTGRGRVGGADSWVEGCRISAPLDLGGRNMVAGADIEEPLSLPPEACLDVLYGKDRRGDGAWFVRCYGLRDTFKDACFCGRPLKQWVSAAGVTLPETSLWDARVFPAEGDAAGYRRWLWMYAPEKATAAEKQAYAAADLYSAAEIATLADHDVFHARRLHIRAAEYARR